MKLDRTTLVNINRSMLLRCWLLSVMLVVAIASRAEGADAPIATDELKAAVAKALPPLTKGALGHRENRTCFACHNQALPVMAMTVARDRGLTIDGDELKEQLQFIAGFLEGNKESYIQGKGQGGQADTAGYALFTLELGGWKPDEATAAVAHYLLNRNADLEHWRANSQRPPSEGSHFTTTYVAMRGLTKYHTAEQKERFEKRHEQVRRWLIKTPAKDHEDRVFRLLGLKLVDADKEEIAAAVKELIDKQRDDGGWAQLDAGEPKAATESDAYATGSALVALHRAGALATNHEVYQRGLRHLLKSQRDDGTWHVASRSRPFQKYFETGFPHGTDQFISCAATGWAATALALAITPAPDLPVNQWTKLAATVDPPYDYSAAVYVPSRQQVLWWGAVSSQHKQGRNDVLAFDVATRRWVPDYRSDSKMPTFISGGGGGSAVSFRGSGAMMPHGRPMPGAIVHGVCLDSKRNQIVYVMKGLMTAYDPKAKTWRDMKPKTELRGWYALSPDAPYGQYERGLPPEKEYKGELVDGPPPVYGAGVCYIPSEDSIVLFPHFGSQNNDRREIDGTVSGHSGTWKYTFSDNTWRRVIDQEPDPRLTPPPRHTTPLVFMPKQNQVLMFGGRGGPVRTDLPPGQRPIVEGGLNDTWLYDAASGQWHEPQVAAQRRPPADHCPQLVFDDDSGLVLLVTRSERGKERLLTLWSFDSATGAWSHRLGQAWDGDTRGWFNLTLDAGTKCLILTQHGRTWMMPLKLDQLKTEPAPEYRAQPIAPHKVAPDDARWIAKIKLLPANEWTFARPSPGTPQRAWGNAAYDDARGWVYYFGGGHSSYQVNDVAIYAVGANAWSHTVGDHNDFAPPAQWDGFAMGFAGGPPAGHQRNSYVAIDGRMYHTAPFQSRRWDVDIAKQEGRRVSWFNDVDRGGIWRQQPIATIELGEGVPGTFGRAHMADPKGRVLGFAGHLEPYDGRFFSKEAYFSNFDIRTNALSVTKIPEPTPGWIGEGRPFCYLPDRNEIFFYEQRAGGGHATWLYHVAENRFEKLEVQRQPPGDARTVEYLPQQQAIFAIIGKGAPWVFSLTRKAWAPLPTTVAMRDVEGKEVGGRAVDLGSPYAQVIYAPRYGVLVNVGDSRGVCVMRPDIASVKWE